MKEVQEESYSLGDLKKAVRSFFRYLTSRWWLMALVMVAGAALGLLYHKIQKPRYEAVTTFVLEEKSSSGGLAGLASQFGFNLGSLTGGGSIFSGDNILEVLKSKKVVQQVLLTAVDPQAKSGPRLADLYLDFTGTKKNWQKKPELAGINFLNAGTSITPLQDSVLNLIYESIVKNNLVTERTRKQGTIIRVQVTAPHSAFARMMAERLVEEASTLYLNIRVGTALENIYQLQRRSDSLLVLLNNKSYRAAASQPLDINPGLRTAIVPVEIATRDKAVIGTLYAEVTKNLEASKLLLSQTTPVIQLMDRPGYLLDDHKKGKLILVVAFAMVAALAYVAVSFFLFLFFRAGRRPRTA